MAKETDIAKITNAVVKVLEDDPESRNDDKRLTFKVLQLLKGNSIKEHVLTLKLRELRKLPAFATITRVRAVIQNELGKYLPTRAEVRRLRRIAEETWLSYITGTEVFPGVLKEN
jgi:hypothetical protein